MQQQYALGQWLRKEYVDNGFVDGNYARSQVISWKISHKWSRAIIFETFMDDLQCCVFTSMYRIAPNFRGTIFSWISWLNVPSQNFFSQSLFSQKFETVHSGCEFTIHAVPKFFAQKFTFAWFSKFSWNFWTTKIWSCMYTVRVHDELQVSNSNGQGGCKDCLGLSCTQVLWALCITKCLHKSGSYRTSWNICWAKFLRLNATFALAK